MKLEVVSFKIFYFYSRTFKICIKYSLLYFLIFIILLHIVSYYHSLMYFKGLNNHFLLVLVENSNNY
jgi:hypothetical protein